MKLFAKQRTVGLEFDEGTIRGVEIITKGGHSTVSSFAQVPLPETAVRDGLIFDQKEVITALEQLWLKGKFRTREVVTGVSNQGVIIRFAQFPKVTPNRLDSMVRFQAQEHLPVPLDSIVLDYDVIGTKSDGEREMLEILLVAGQRAMLDGFLQVLNGARLRPKEIEVIPLTLLRFLKKEQTHQVVAIIDIANGLSNMVIADALKPRLARMMPSGLRSAEKLVAATREEASGFDADSDEHRQFVSSIQATIGFYQSHKEARPVEKILLSGKGSQVKGLAAGLEHILRLPCSVVKPLECLKLRINGIQAADLTEYSVAAGLACRSWE